ncbi:hypothetical protein EJ110_NYTH35397 [Nymphaea thermarum]|nr:hypothetical protein EJ110_NYTH35397 [Nymphaea thermarum]
MDFLMAESIPSGLKIPESEKMQGFIENINPEFISWARQDQNQSIAKSLDLGLHERDRSIDEYFKHAKLNAHQLIIVAKLIDEDDLVMHIL